MGGDLELDQYLDRIRWGGATSPSWATLTGIMRAHVEQVPFENLDVLLGRPIHLDLERLQQKLVRDRRGGYCYEHVTLFGAVLDALGFEVRRHSGRVIQFTPETAAPRTHVFLTVRLPEGTFVVDPGFGSHTPRLPLPLVDGEEVAVADEAHWMARVGERWKLRTRIGGETLDGWITNLEDENPIDFEMGNHFMSTYPKAFMVNRMSLRAITAEGDRVIVVDRDVTKFLNGPSAERSRLDDRTALRTLLRTHFGFDLPEVEQLKVPAIADWL